MAMDIAILTTIHHQHHHHDHHDSSRVCAARCWKVKGNLFLVKSYHTWPSVRPTRLKVKWLEDIWPEHGRTRCPQKNWVIWAWLTAACSYPRNITVEAGKHMDGWMESKGKLYSKLFAAASSRALHSSARRANLLGHEVVWKGRSGTGRRIFWTARTETQDEQRALVVTILQLSGKSHVVTSTPGLLRSSSQIWEASQLSLSQPDTVRQPPSKCVKSPVVNTWVSQVSCECVLAHGPKKGPYEHGCQQNSQGFGL